MRRKIFLLIMCYPLSAFSQFKNPCISKDEKIDLSCRCRLTKSCYKPLKKVDKKIYKMGGQTPMDKKLTKVVFKSHKLDEKLFSGQLKDDSKEVKSLIKLNKKLSKINAKKLKAYEKLLKSKGVKKWKMKDRVKAANKLLLKTIPKGKKEILEKNGFGNDFAKFIAKKSGITDYVPLKTNTKGNKIILAREDGKRIEEIQNSNVTDKTNSSPFVNQDASKLVEKSKDKKYKFNTINKNAQLSLFKIISNRYSLIHKRLDQKAISGFVGAEEKKKIIDSIIEMLPRA